MFGGVPHRCIKLEQLQQVMARNVACARQHGIERGSGVTLAQYEPIPPGPVCAKRVMAHFPEIEAGQHVDARKRSPHVARARVVNHSQDCDPQFTGNLA